MDASNLKRQKHCDTELEDRISNLPDSTLCHILSFVTTLCSVRTSCLSRRWRYLWTSVPALDFQDVGYVSSLMDKNRVNSFELFENFVNTVFILHSNASIRRFRLHLSSACPSYSHRSTSYVNSWILAASTHNVEELDINTASFRVHFPRVLYQSKKLISFKLGSDVALNVPEFVNLPSLKLLHLGYRSCPSSASMSRIIFGCPTLEDLAIDMCSNLLDAGTLSIISSSLKRFEFTNIYLRCDLYTVVLNAPQLRFLHLTGISFYKPRIQINDFSSVTKASIDFDYCGDATSRMRFFSLFMTRVKSAFKGHFWTNLTQMELRYCGADLKTLLIILKYMPSLEDLGLKCESCHHTVACEALQNVKHDMYCLKHSLKVFKLRPFKEKEADLQITEYILKRAKLLKEVRIYTEKEPDVEVLKKLLMFPRCSETCRIAVISI